MTPEQRETVETDLLRKLMRADAAIWDKHQEKLNIGAHSDMRGPNEGMLTPSESAKVDRRAKPERLNAEAKPLTASCMQCDNPLRNRQGNGLCAECNRAVKIVAAKNKKEGGRGTVMFTGKRPCSNCGGFIRLLSNKQCPKCLSEKVIRSQQQHRVRQSIAGSLI